MTRRNSNSTLLTLLAGLLLAQSALAGPPPPRGNGAPQPRNPTGTSTTTPKRVCIDLALGQADVKLLPQRAWPYGVRPDGKTAYVIMQSSLRNNSTVDYPDPVDVVFSVFDPKSGWKPFLEVRKHRGVKAGEFMLVEGTRYYVVGPWPNNTAVRAELKGTRGERNDCNGSNDISRPAAVDFQKLSQLALTTP